MFRSVLALFAVVILGYLSVPTAKAGTLVQLCEVQRNACLIQCQQAYPWGAYATSLQLINENCGWNTYKVPRCSYNYYSQPFACSFTLYYLGFAPGQQNYSRLAGYNSCIDSCPRCGYAGTPVCQ